jgi:hypothetical protein
MKVLSIPALEPQKTVILFILINDFQFVSLQFAVYRLNLTLKNDLLYVNANFKNFFNPLDAFIHHGIVIF